MLNDLLNWVDSIIVGYIRWAVVMFFGLLVGCLFVLCIPSRGHRVLAQNGSGVTVEIRVGEDRRMVAPGQSERFTPPSGDVVFAAYGPGINESYTYTLPRDSARCAVYNVGGLERLAVVTLRLDERDEEPSIEMILSPVIMLDRGVWLSRDYVDERFDAWEGSEVTTLTQVCRVNGGRIGCAMPDWVRTQSRPPSTREPQPVSRRDERVERGQGDLKRLLPYFDAGVWQRRSDRATSIEDEVLRSGAPQSSAPRARPSHDGPR